jgi:hypothetical protein
MSKFEDRISGPMTLSINNKMGFRRAAKLPVGRNSEAYCAGKGLIRELALAPTAEWARRRVGRNSEAYCAGKGLIRELALAPTAGFI